MAPHAVPISNQDPDRLRRRRTSCRINGGHITLPLWIFAVSTSGPIESETVFRRCARDKIIGLLVVNGPGCTFPSSLGVKLVHGQEIYLRLPEVILLLIALRYDRPIRHKNEVICFGAPHYGTPAQGSPIVVCCWAIKSVAHDVAFQRSTRTRESQHHSIRPETFDQTCRAHRIVQHETEVGIFLLASIALIMVTSPSYKNRNGHLPKESGAAAELSATSGQRLIVHNPVRGIQQFVAGKLRTCLLYTSRCV